MLHVQFELENGEIVNAALSDCGLFCENCEWLVDFIFADNIHEDTDGRFECGKFELPLNTYNRKPQAHPACQIAAQKVESD